MNKRRGLATCSVMCVISALGCHPAPKTNAPFVAAAGAKDAQAQARHFKEQWELSSPTGRRALRPDLEAFVRRHRGDPSVREAELMLAEIALEERRFGAAEELLQPLLRQREGRLRDEAQLLLAAVEIRQGKLDQGLERLAPLEGKLISASAEERFYREQISAAIAARRWRLAVDAMQAWLEQQGQSNGKSVQAWIGQALMEIPAPALFHMLRPEPGTTIHEPRDQEQRWLLHALIERISREALANQDSQLARGLLDAVGPSVKSGERGEALLKLASQADTAAQISGRAVGILLGGETELERTRNLRVAAGVLQALAESRERGLHVDYVTAEDRGSTALALDDLSGQGASFVIGGVDETSARAALLFAQAQLVPTIVSVQPRVAPPASLHGFVVGVAEAEEVEAMAAFHEQRGAAPGLVGQPLILGGEEQPCSELMARGLASSLGRAVMFWVRRAV